LGLVLGLTTRKEGRLAGMTLGLGVVLAYYAVIALAEAWTKSGARANGAGGGRDQERGAHERPGRSRRILGPLDPEHRPRHSGNACTLAPHTAAWWTRVASPGSRLGHYQTNPDPALGFEIGRAHD